SEVSGARLSIFQSCSLEDRFLQFDGLGVIQILDKVRGIINRNQIRGMHIVSTSLLCDLIHHCAPCFWLLKMRLNGRCCFGYSGYRWKIFLSFPEIPVSAIRLASFSWAYKCFARSM